MTMRAVIMTFSCPNICGTVDDPHRRPNGQKTTNAATSHTGIFATVRSSSGSLGPAPDYAKLRLFRLRFGDALIDCDDLIL